MGRIIVLGGPSGGGKTTLQQMLLERCGMQRIVGATCRAPRDGERDGVDYHFMTDAQFDAAVAADEFAETTTYAHVRYGVLRRDLEAVVQSDAARDAVVVLNDEGVHAMQQAVGAARVVAVYVDADEADLRSRLERRGDGADRIAQRLEWARTVERAPAYVQTYAHCITNTDADGIERAYDALVSVLFPPTIGVVYAA